MKWMGIDSEETLPMPLLADDRTDCTAGYNLILAVLGLRNTKTLYEPSCLPLTFL